jgi:hypothetical protein
MSDTLASIRKLVADGDVRVSDHGYDELVADDLSAREVVEGVDKAAIVEDYPDYHKGRCVLTLQRDRKGAPIHVVWGIPKMREAPAVLVTAYRPDPERWTDDFTRRK